MTKVLLAGSAAADPHLARTLRNDGYQLANATTNNELVRFDLNSIQAVVYGTRDTNYGFIKKLPGVPVIIVSRNPEPAAIVEAMRAGAVNYLVRPIDTDNLLAALEQACATAATDVDTPEAKAVMATMLGDCKPMRELFERIRKIGPTSSNVLIQGETGTGKELIARALHATSDRRHQTMMVMNCGAIPETLQEVELFGDAGPERVDSAGLVEAANNSTLFLDEVSELTPGAQTKLLRVLQINENRRLGTHVKRHVDIRLVCAAQRDLHKLVEQGDFRKDLFYRLNVVTLTPPPLRERSADILLLARQFLERGAKKLGHPKTSFSDAAIEALQDYNWPGNVREMENAVERALILANGRTIEPDLLAIDQGEAAASEPVTQPDSQVSLEEYFVKFVTENQDQFTETELAERLGISRKSLWQRRQRLNIPRKKTRKRGPRRS